jgi:hypothetical protein
VHEAYGCDPQSWFAGIGIFDSPLNVHLSIFLEPRAATCEIIKSNPTAKVWIRRVYLEIICNFLLIGNNDATAQTISSRQESIGEVVIWISPHAHSRSSARLLSIPIGLLTEGKYRYCCFGLPSPSQWSIKKIYPVIC